MGTTQRSISQTVDGSYIAMAEGMDLTDGFIGQQGG